MPKDGRTYLAAVPARASARSREVRARRDRALLGEFTRRLREDRLLTLSGFAGGIVGTEHDAALIGAFLEARDEGKSP